MANPTPLPHNSEVSPTALARDFREAFCRRYRCTPAEYERRAFWKTVQRHALVLIPAMGGFDRKLFAKDLEALRLLGRAVTTEDLEGVLAEFGGVNTVERSIRRRWLGMRISGARMARLFGELSTEIAQPAEPAPVLPAGPVSPAVLRRPDERPGSAAAAASSPPSQPAKTPMETPAAASLAPASPVPPTAAARLDPEVAAGLEPRLRRVHEAVVRGVTLDAALRETRLSRDEAVAALERLAPGRPELGWLKAWIRERGELLRLQQENDQLRATVGALSSRLAGGA